MQVLRRILVAAVVLALVPAAARAGWGVGIGFGGPYFGPRVGFGFGYYPYYRPYYPYYVAPPVIVQPAPVVQTVPVVQPAYASPPPPPAAAPPAQPQPETAPPPTPYSPAARQADVEAYLQQLSSPDERTRAEAVLQLGRMKAQRAVEPLVQILGHDRSPVVREAAARGLGLIGAPNSLPALQQAAQADDDRDVRHSAGFAADVIRASYQR